MNRFAGGVNRCQVRVLGIASRHLPNWAKFILRPMFASYLSTVSTLRKTRRRLHAPPVPRNGDGQVYIHLGCGEVNAPGFINVDIVPLPHIHYVQEVSDLSVFPDEYADLIYASHVLEHVSHREIAKVLREWNRVLKAGGILRISVPDFDKLIKVYFDDSNAMHSIIGCIMGGQDHLYDFHKALFNEVYLRGLLLSAGFKDVREWDPAAVEMHSFEDWASRPLDIAGRNYPISLNLEGLK